MTLSSEHTKEYFHSFTFHSFSRGRGPSERNLFSLFLPFLYFDVFPHDIYHKSVVTAASERILESETGDIVTAASEIILESETGTSPDPELQSIVYYLHLLLSRQLLEKRIIYINNISQLFTITFASFFLGNSFLLPNSASPFIT